jgi:hypothetical protein
MAFCLWVFGGVSNCLYSFTRSFNPSFNHLSSAKATLVTPPGEVRILICLLLSQNGDGMGSAADDEQEDGWKGRGLSFTSRWW